MSLSVDKVKNDNDFRNLITKIEMRYENESHFSH